MKLFYWVKLSWWHFLHSIMAALLCGNIRSRKPYSFYCICLKLWLFFQRLHNSPGTIFTSIRSQLDVIIKPKFFQQKKGERIGHFVTMIQRCKIIYFSRLNLNSTQQKAFSYNSWKNLRYKLRLFKMLS